MAERLKKILYVEDDESIAVIVMMILVDLGGLSVKRCASGQEALDALSSYAPQLVLMDVMMPGMSGAAAMQVMQTRPDVKNIPVVFMTAKAQEHEQQGLMKLGAIGVVVKPFDPMELREKLEGFWSTVQQDRIPAL